MLLKSVELFGFKSFADRTKFELDQGVTAIVGPNGCGKSNVFDAVKWVLGEQSARSLRGREMMDVIFNGSSRRPAMGMAEVGLHFDNSDGTLPIDTVDVEITRRLYRSGDSEYLINNQVCRLRDVRELFMGTGLGPGGYSFMEQGKIDSVLASNPVERRRVFEEAAGISRFRARRHETELKLDKVDANLLRLDDIIEELARQQRSLKLQAGKARRYREYSQRSKELQAQVALYRYDKFSRRFRELEASLQALRERRDSTVTEREKWRERVSAIELDLTASTEKLATLREQTASVAAQEKAAADLIEFHRQHLEGLSSRAEGRHTEIKELESEIEHGEAELERNTTETQRAAQEAAQLRQELADREAVANQLRDASSGLEQRIRSADTEVEERRGRQSELDRLLAGFESEERRWSDAAEQARARLDAIEDEEKALAERRADLEKTCRRLAEALTEAQEQLAASESALEEVEASLSERIEAHRAKGAEVARVTSRIEVLERHITHQEGVSGGARKILGERKKRADFLPGCRGLLLDLISVDLDRADAIEAALGDMVQALVVETAAEALQGATRLETNGGGRAGFLALDGFASEPIDLPEGVRVDDEAVARAVSALLRGVDVMEPQALAEAIRRGETPRGFVVTVNGGLVRDGRLFLAGRAEGEKGLVAVRSELESLRRDVVEMEKLEAELAQSVDDLRARREELRQQSKRQRTVHMERRSEAASVEHELAAAEKETDRLVEERRRVEDAAAKARGSLIEVAERREALREEYAENESSLREGLRLRDASSSERDAHRARTELATAAVESARLELVTAEHRQKALEEALAHVQARVEKAHRSIERCREELTGFAGEKQRSEEALDDGKQRGELFRKDLERFRGEMKEVEAVVADIKTRYAEATEKLREIEAEQESRNEDVHTAEMESNEVRVNLDNLSEHIRDELELDLESLHADYVPADIDWDATEAELDELRDGIRRLGNVNMAAIDDLAEVEERFDFLTVQRTDLLHSKQHLAKVLADIEQESTRLFLETFNKVREHFQGMFRKLFGGGKADIELLDEENVLESGIEITARPPGKQARSITLLSGGERTLTAVSLLFAIIRAHPCPCCLLDEVDAALDEDNTERFASLLEGFFDSTQFVLITHSRRTMSNADTLFGVTMAERGVSRHVGVRFDEVAADGSIKDLDEKARASSRKKKSDSKSNGKANGNGRSSNGNGNGKAKGNGSGVAAGPGSDVLLDIDAAADDPASGGAAGPATPPAPQREAKPAEKAAEE